ncbi:MAG: ABC transporter ATP-binding protein [Lachnospiraceae bacterium]|nr:ABC transporter ATP-binding protein [Lachnospiraceae bacterium]
MEREAVIRVKDLYKVYRMGDTKVYALNGVDFEIYRGEFCAITGPSGSGKSTLLNMLAGLEHPSKGEIVIAKKHIERLNERQLVAFRRERVGFIFQSYNLIATLNALENVALPLSFRGIGRTARNKQARQYLKLVGLERFMKHMPNQMSGGQQQRVGIARALAVSPQIIFADEPTGNLDSKTTMEILRLMKKIVREQNQTLVMVTHDNNLATYADRIFKIIDGKIVHIEEGHQEVDLLEAEQAAETREETAEVPGRETSDQKAAKKETEEQEFAGKKAGAENLTEQQTEDKRQGDQDEKVGED